MGNCWGTPVDNLTLNLNSTSNPKSYETLKPDVVNRAPPLATRDSSPGVGGIRSERRSDDNVGPQKVPTTVLRGGEGGGGERKPAEVRKPAIAPNLKVFTLAELMTATRNFRPDTMLGEGGFGKVFKGWVEEKTYAPSKPGVGIPIAVKKSSPDSPQGHLEWQAEVKMLGKFSHPNLVKLLGYCREDNQFLLVYEYMQKRSLENHLFVKGIEPLSWEVRLKIAIGAARGLAFLHNAEKSVIYRDFKASNILLDGEYNAKLSDFGLAKFGPVDGSSHVTTRIIGTYGYAAPEYIATGHLYIKSDVYGFGVVLLELLTGLQALDQNRPSGSHNLVEWAKPSLSDKRKLKKLVDPRLENLYPIKAAVLVSELILRCLDGDQKKRPSMQEVLYALERINLIKDYPKEAAKPRPMHREEPSPHRHLNHHRPPVNRPGGGDHRHPWPTIPQGGNSM